MAAKGKLTGLNSFTVLSSDGLRNSIYQIAKFLRSYLGVHSVTHASFVVT